MTEIYGVRRGVRWGTLTYPPSVPVMGLVSWDTIRTPSVPPLTCAPYRSVPPPYYPPY
jgi:hypothetical protein